MCSRRKLRPAGLSHCVSCAASTSSRHEWREKGGGRHYNAQLVNAAPRAIVVHSFRQTRSGEAGCREPDAGEAGAGEDRRVLTGPCPTVSKLQLEIAVKHATTFDSTDPGPQCTRLLQK